VISGDLGYSRVLSGDLGYSRMLSGGVEMRAFSSSIFWRSVSEEVSSAGRVPETAVSSSEREAKLADSRCSSGGSVPLRPSLPSASMAMRRESEASERGNVPSSRLPCRKSPITSPPPL